MTAPAHERPTITLGRCVVDAAKGAIVHSTDIGNGPDLVFLHDITGPLNDMAFLEPFARTHRVVAPELPGFGASSGEELSDDILDFALHGWDVLDELAVHRPVLVGHGMGGMIAAGMAALCPDAVDRLVLAAPLGLWLDGAPVPDLLSLLPDELPRVLFADPEAGAHLLSACGQDFTDLESLSDFHLGTARRLGTAGKILSPAADRGLDKLLYRVTVPTLLLWGDADALVDPVHARHWAGFLPHARVRSVPDTGHMLPHESPDEFRDAVYTFLAEPMGSLTATPERSR